MIEAVLLSTAPAQPRLLPRGHQTWGILRSIEPVGGGLICATLGTQERLVPEELYTDLAGMIGRPVAVVRIDDEYRCGVIRA
jgi:hypothetical protein